MDRKAINRGFEFEKHVAKVLDSKLVPGSGNQWYAKGDVTGHGLSISCKSEKTYGYNRVIRYLREAIDNAQGTGEIAALALEDKDDKEQLVVMRLSDFANAISGGITSIPAGSGKSKGELKREEANVPLLLRED